MKICECGSINNYRINERINDLKISLHLLFDKWVYLYILCLFTKWYRSESWSPESTCWPRLRGPGRLYQWKASPAALQQRSARPPGRGYRMNYTGWTQTTSGRVVSAINSLKVRHAGLGGTLLNGQSHSIEEGENDDSFEM